MLPFRVVSIHGAPRSGTSWLGQIFNSHPEVAYRFQPLFSYRFKGAIKRESSRAEIENFLRALYEVGDDEFILQTNQKLRGAHPADFVKKQHPSVLVMKEVRYHYLIETLLRQVEDIKVVGIVRHPCGAINSWLKTPREFKPEWDPSAEWRDAPSKNQGRPEEYYGFARWLELVRLFSALQRNYPGSFYLIRYEALVARSKEAVRDLFAFCGLDMPPQAHEFLEACRQREVDDPDTVFRRPDVVDRWRYELDPQIRDAILNETSSLGLEGFL